MSLWQQYLRPQNLTDALHALSARGDFGGAVAVVAGGTDLLLDLDQGRHAAVETLVDVTDVQEMLEIQQRDDFIDIGAALPLGDVISDDLVRSHFTALVEACELIGGPQVRNVATLGGNVAHALPAGDGTIALLALGAEAEIASENGANWVSMEELFFRSGRAKFRSCQGIGREISSPGLACGREVGVSTYHAPARRSNCDPEHGCAVASRWAGDCPGGAPGYRPGGPATAACSGD